MPISIRPTEAEFGPQKRKMAMLIGSVGTARGFSSEESGNPMGRLSLAGFGNLLCYSITASTSHNVIIVRMGANGDEQISGYPSLYMNLGQAAEVELPWSAPNNRYQASSVALKTYIVNNAGKWRGLSFLQNG